MKRALPFAAAVAAFAIARSAAAQDPPPAQASEDQLAKPLEPPAGVGAEPAAPKAEEGPEVRVIGGRADSLQRVPGSGTVIGSKTLERADPQDLAEILRRVPGVQARQEYGGGNRLDISIRGLDSGRSRRVLMLEDGIPLSLNPYAEPDMYFGPAVERYRAIEVVKGSGNILFGPQTLAGTINFVTITPPDHQMVMGDVEAGSFGYVRGLARYGDTIGDTRYVVQALQRHGDGFRDQPFDSTDALAKVIYPTGKDGELVLRLGFHRDENGSDDVGMTTKMWNDDPKRRTLAPHDHSILDRYDIALIHEQRFSSDTKLKTLIYAYETDRIWRRQDFVRAPAPGDSYERIEGDPSIDGGAIYFKNTNTILDRQYTVVGLEPRAEHRVKTAGIGHTIDFGGRVEREQAHYSQRSGDYPESFAGSDDFEERHTGTAFAAYLQDRMAMTEKLLVTPGIRWEHFEFRRTIQRENVGTNVQDVFQQGSQSVNGVVPGIAGVYGTKDANLFAGFHVGFAPPRITSAITAQGVPAEVHAENSLNYEAGTRVGPTRWLRLEATGFLSNFDNQVIASSQPGAGGETLLTDAGATNILGVESGVLFSADKAFGLGATIVEAGVRYNFTRATFRYGPNAGNILPYSPEHTVTANLDVEHPSGFGGQIAYAHVGPQFTDAQNTRREDASGQLGPLDPWDILDATLHYRHKPSGVTLRVTGKNVLDATYIAARRPNGIFPGPFRQVLFGVRWEWERNVTHDVAGGAATPP
ncbi:MAG TPA: TonB-dependent receptor [Labilithrix sp.]